MSIKKMPVSELKNVALSYSSWHHTSNHFNRTSFYSLDIWSLCDLTDERIKEIIANSKEEKKQEKPVEEKWKCAFLEWSGTRNHPVSKEITEEGIVKGKWFFRENGTKKKTTANGFRFIEKIQ
jgi:hypothetical protein